MTRRRGRQKPSDPQVITASRSRDPATWGVSAEIIRLETSRDVEVNFDPHRRGRILNAKRSDAFSAITMSPNQERAANRYWRAWCHRACIVTDDPRVYDDVQVDRSPSLTPGQYLTDRMVDAGKELDEVHREVGRADAILLTAIVEPLVMKGEIRVWRVLVKQVTGETERHAQAAAVRRAAENLHLAYEAIDERRRRLRDSERRSTGSGAARAAEA